MTIKAYRQSKNMTQKQIADMIGISQPAYSSLESGAHSPGGDLLIKIANTLNVYVGYIPDSNIIHINMDVRDSVSVTDNWKDKPVYAGMLADKWHISSVAVEGYLFTTYNTSSKIESKLADAIERFFK